MNTLTLSYAAKALDLPFEGQDLAINGITTDSKKVIPGDLFVAIVGAKVDGHDFIAEAEKNGAIAVLASKTVTTSLPTLLVSDSIQALGRLARAYRSQFHIPMIAVTGSCGKTTVKEMLAGILALQGPVLSNQGNLNTDVGLPLTLLRLQPEHQSAVVEMGARHLGDIAYLMSLANPTVSLITNAGVAHLEIFGSEKGIAEAKGEIYSNLDEAGTAIINIDDPNAKYWQGLLKARQKYLTFGLEHPAQISAQNVVMQPCFSEFDLVTDLGSTHIHLLAPGKHNILNALAAAAGARGLNVSLADIKSGLERFMPVKGRLQFKKGYKGVTIIDDTYNANPISVKAALSVLATLPGQKIFIMGDMFELGKEELSLHQQTGLDAKNLKIDQLLGVGAMTEEAVKGFGNGATHFINKEQLIKNIVEKIDMNLGEPINLLIKGSRGMRMEEIVVALTTDCQEKTSC